MRVHVHFMSILGELMGITNPILELPDGSTFKELMRLIRDRYGDKFPPKLYEDGQFKMIHIMLNRKDVYEDKDADRPIHEGDELYFIPPIGGGASSTVPAR